MVDQEWHEPVARFGNGLVSRSPWHQRPALAQNCDWIELTGGLELLELIGQAGGNAAGGVEILIGEISVEHRHEGVHPLSDAVDHAAIH